MNKIGNFDLNNILIEEKSDEIILIYDILCKTFFVPKPLRIRFAKINGFIRVFDGNRYLVLFGLEKYDAIYNRMKYFISQKILKGITYVFANYYPKNKNHFYDRLSLCIML